MNPTATQPQGVAEGFAHQRLLMVPPVRIRQALNQVVTRDLCVTHLGQFSEAPGHLVIREGGAAEWVLIYCLAGQGQVLMDDQEMAIGSGDLVVLPPGRPHRYFADAEAPWRIFWFHFVGERAEDFVSALGLDEGSWCMHSPAVNEMQRAFEGTYRHALDGFSDSGMLGLSTSFARMIGLFRRFARSRNDRSRDAEDRVHRVMINLQEQLEREWTVEDMALLAGMSKTHFTSKFRSQAGEPPMAYLINQRMQRAAAQLKQGNKRISEIASRLGYQDAYYFSRLFRNTFSISPRAYRSSVQARLKSTQPQGDAIE